MDLLKAFKRVEDKKNYYYSKLTTTMEIEGVKFRFPSIEYALNERAAEELQKNSLTMPIEMQEHIFGEINSLYFLYKFNWILYQTCFIKMLPKVFKIAGELRH